MARCVQGELRAASRCCYFPAEPESVNPPAAEPVKPNLELGYDFSADDVKNGDGYICGHSPEVIMSAFDNAPQVPPQKRVRSWLDGRVGRELANRIRYLLNLRYDQCGPDHIPNNCMGTLLWTIGASTDEKPVIYGNIFDNVWYACDSTERYTGINASEQLRRLLGVKGYHYLDSRRVITPEKVHSEALKGLRAGDILLFSIAKDGPHSRFGHAALYLGKNHKGKHIVFEKPNGKCGRSSSYQIIALEPYLKELSYAPERSDNALFFIHVYRK